MPFQDYAESVRDRLHIPDSGPPALVGVLMVMIAVAAGIVFVLAQSFGYRPVDVIPAADATERVVHGDAAEKDQGSSDEQASQSDDVPSLAIHVVGCVENPGLYFLHEGARVADALDAAGGLTESAAVEAVNLARPLNDGEQVHVLSQQEFEEGAIASANQSLDIAKDENPPVTPGGRININTATASELQTLSGVGAATAAKIIEDRSANGPFKTIEDLKRVSGIGDKKYDALKDFICVR